MSLRVKVSIALLCVLLLSMGVNFAFAFDLFKKDKTSYVFDSLGTLSKSQADLLSLRLQKLAMLAPRSFIDKDQTEVLGPLGVDFAARYVRGPNGPTEDETWKKSGDLDAGAARIVQEALVRLEKSENAVISIDDRRAVVAFRVQGMSGRAERQPGAVAPVAAIAAGAPAAQAAAALTAQAAAGAVAVCAMVVDKALAFGADLGEDSGAADLLDFKGQSLIAQDSLPAPLRDSIAERFRASSVNSWLSEAGAKGDAPGAAKEFLVSAARASFGDVIAVRLVSKSEAFASVRKLGYTFGLMFILIFFISLASGVGVVSRLTSALGEISSAAEEIGRGNYEVRIVSRSRDEIGRLAERFNQMAKEVSELMTSKAEKVRMESELKTAKEVQDKLFPEPTAELGSASVSGYYMPATECGGDWWGYAKIGSRALFFIGDATGHGAPAALVTSAVKATCTITTRLGMTDPAEIMDMLNSAVFETSKGTVCMTFFIASLDLDSGEMLYCNASHEAALMLPKDAADLSWRDLTSIIDNNHPRLGEKFSASFKCSTRQLSSGEGIFLYTDGVLDVRDAKDSQFGERRLARSVLESAQADARPEKMSNSFQADIEKFRTGTALVDDVSFLFFRWTRPA